MAEMKRVLMLGLVLFMLLSAGLSFAAPAYGPNMPDKGKWEMGIQGNFVFERDMEGGNGEAESVQYFYTLR